MTTNKYHNSVIYKLVKQDDYDNENIYIGSTCNFRNRKYQHNQSCNNINTKNYNMPIYKYIRDNGGWNDWVMVEVESYKAETKLELNKRERYWIETLKTTLNKNIPSRTKKEHRKDNAEQIAIYKKDYDEKNREHRLKVKKLYRENNAYKIKQYADENRDILRAKAKEQITCECGCIFRRDSLAKHKKTKNHLDLMLKNRR